MEPEFDSAKTDQVGAFKPDRSLESVRLQEVAAMAKKINPVPFIVAVGIAIVLQLVLIGVDGQPTPTKIARSFAEDYYYFDPDMRSLVCKALTEQGAVDDFLYRKSQQAHARGFSINYLRHKFTELHLELVKSDKTTATVHLEGTTRVCIYPPFMIIGQLFGIGRDYPVDKTIDLVKENGQWRVCGNPFGLHQPA
jgi:hypothetical protein